MIANTIEDSVASLEEWLELRDKAAELDKPESKFDIQVDSKGHCLASGNQDDELQRFDELARYTTIYKGCADLTGEAARGFLAILLRDYFMKQTDLRREVGLVGHDKEAIIAHPFKAAKIYFGHLASREPATDIMRRRNIQGSQAGLDTAKTVPEPETKIDGEGDSQQNVLIVHFSKIKKGWRVKYGPKEITLDRHYIGADHYRVLVTNPDRVMPAIQVEILTGGISDDQPANSRELLNKLMQVDGSEGDLVVEGEGNDPRIDKTAMRQLKDACEKLREERESETDPERRLEITEKLDQVEKYIRSSTRQSKSGKVLKVLSNKAPLRKAAARVRRNIGTFLKNIEHRDHGLAIDLNRGLKLGDDCCFTPDPHRPIDFRFD